MAWTLGLLYGIAWVFGEHGLLLLSFAIQFGSGIREVLLVFSLCGQSRIAHHPNFHLLCRTCPTMGAPEVPRLPFTAPPPRPLSSSDSAMLGTEVEPATLPLSHTHRSHAPFTNPVGAGTVSMAGSATARGQVSERS